MKYVVTGGAGFIGSNLVDQLVKKKRYKLILFLTELSSKFERNGLA